MLAWLWNYVFVFMFVLTVVVFVHEFGHFLLARLNGVRVEVFSIGFGPELIGYTAKKTGTRWKFCVIPVGGYVKMFGDSNAASMPEGGDSEEDALSPEEKAVAFPYKKLWQRASIVAAGPLFNLAFGVLLLAVIFLIYGENRLAPSVGKIQPDSAAMEAGLEPGDRFIAANGETVGTFQDLQRIVAMTVQGPVELTVKRGEETLFLDIVPRVVELDDGQGNVSRRLLLGVEADSSSYEHIDHGLTSAFAKATSEAGQMISMTLTAVGQMISGRRDTDELSGPLRIAKGAGQASQAGVGSITFYIVLLSINLGLINLFPIPLLDGGHLLFYGVEALRGKPLGSKAQEYGFRLGVFLVLALMIVATRNDLVDLKVWDIIVNLVS